MQRRKSEFDLKIIRKKAGIKKYGAWTSKSQSWVENTVDEVAFIIKSLKIEWERKKSSTWPVALEDIRWNLPEEGMRLSVWTSLKTM